MMDYKHAQAQTRGSTGRFDGGDVGSCQAVGAAVEKALRLAHRPAVGSLPVPLVCQSTGMIPCVVLHDVRKPGASDRPAQL